MQRPQAEGEAIFRTVSLREHKSIDMNIDGLIDLLRDYPRGSGFSPRIPDSQGFVRFTDCAMQDGIRIRPV